MMRIRLMICLAGLAGLTAAAPAPFELQRPDFRTYDFETGEVPAEFTAGPGSRLGISREHYKSGGKSLRWDWDREGAWIQYKSPEAFRHLTGQNPDPIVYEWVTFCDLSAFAMWIFCEKPLGKQLECTVEPKSGFYVNMNFDGWAPVNFIYGRDLAVFPENADTLTVRAPKGVAKGTIYIDDFAPRRERDVRSVMATSRQPYLNNKELKSDRVLDLPRAQDAVFSVMLLNREGKRIALPEITGLAPEQERLLERLSAEFLTQYRMPPQEYRTGDGEYAKLLAYRQQFKLERSGKFVSGQIGRAMKFYEAWGELARAYHSGQLSAERREELLVLMMDMADLVIQQGHDAFYVLRTSFIGPVMLMRGELEKTGRYEPLIARLRNIIGVNDFYLEQPVGNADYYNTLLYSAYAVIFLQNGKIRQWQDLLALKHWLDATADNGEIMADGTFMHHRMIYSGYAFPAIGPICTVLHHLRGTPFFAGKMYERARTAIMAMSFYSNPYAPHMFSGRWRVCDNFSSRLNALALLAGCHEPPDAGPAARYLYYRGDTPEAEVFREAGIAPDPMNGSLALNYAVSLTHRRGQTTATVRGQRSGLFANEIYAFQGGNTMGRYLNYGQLQILGETPARSGFVMDKGWDFNHWPGTTARVLPFDALRQHFENVEALTGEYFAGATTLDGNGAWAMKLREEAPEVDDPLRVGPPRYFLGQEEYEKRCRESRYDTSFRARKSMFFFDGKIIALGSAIASSDDAPVVTTLFQNSLEKAETVSRRHDSGAALWLTSATGHTYYIPAGNREVVFESGFMKKPYHSHWFPRKPEKHREIKPNEGPMELAFINHGPNAEGAGYEYCIFLNGSDGSIPYRVLRRDRQAHIVRDTATDTTGYALFEAGPGDGLLRSADAPCIAMIREKADGNLAVSLFNPRFDDFSIADIPRQRHVKTRITLHGNWSLIDGREAVEAVGRSTFTVTNRDMLPVIFELAPGK